MKARFNFTGAKYHDVKGWFPVKLVTIMPWAFSFVELTAPYTKEWLKSEQFYFRKFIHMKDLEIKQ